MKSLRFDFNGQILLSVVLQITRALSGALPWTYSKYTRQNSSRIEIQAMHGMSWGGALHFCAIRCPDAKPFVRPFHAQDNIAMKWGH
jgi:hypothetical protein